MFVSENLFIEGSRLIGLTRIVVLFNEYKIDYLIQKFRNKRNYLLNILCILTAGLFLI